VKASVVISFILSDECKLTLPVCLDRLQHQTVPCEVIAIDGDAFKPRVSQCVGEAIGASRATGDVIFFTDPDRFVPLDWVERHLNYYPDFDLVAGPVRNHPVFDLEDMNFGNISLTREVLDFLPIRNMAGQWDVDFAYRFLSSGFKGIVDQSIMVEEPDFRKANASHYFYAAHNHFVLRRQYRKFPPLSELKQLRHPSQMAGALAGLLDPSSRILRWYGPGEKLHNGMEEKA
jgi:hypothetical protein